MAPKSAGSSCTNDMVKLETMARINSVPWANKSNEFAVMVRVTAPPRRNDESSCTAVDLVAVLDISGSMKGERLESMKEAMMFIIGKLGPEDRLSLVPFDNKVEVKDIMELSFMSDPNQRKIAEHKVKELQIRGGTNMAKGMQAAATILQERGPEEKNTRAGRIIFLSDGDDDKIFDATISSEFPADTFGLSDGHQPKALRHIADKTSGTYSYVNEDLKKIKSAFAQSIGGLTSITALGIQIQLNTREGVTISSIESGAYKKSIGTDKQSGTIQINDMYAGEQKNFIVFLTIPEKTKKLMTVSGCYKTSNGASIPLDGSEVAVARPWLFNMFADETVEPEVEVEAELARLELVKVVWKAVEKKECTITERIEGLWKKIRGSEDRSKDPKQTLANLNKEVDRMKNEGEPFMLSWLTSHLWQRATTKDSPSESLAFQIPAMKKLVGQAENRPVPDPISPPEIILKIICDKAINWTAEHRYYSCTLALLLLAGALLTMLHKGSPAATGGPDVRISEDYEIKIQEHPSWLNMEKSLQAITLKKTEDSGITSFLQGASAEDMSDATSRYLLLALVQASILRSRCASAPTIALLEEKVEKIEVEKMELRVMLDALMKEEGNKEALERANTRITKLEQQLQDKKAFVDSLLSEVANADAHLKTCNQKVHMLEAKVRETEDAVVVA